MPRCGHCSSNGRTGKDEWQEPADERSGRYLVPIVPLLLRNRSQKSLKVWLTGMEKRNGMVFLQHTKVIRARYSVILRPA